MPLYTKQAPCLPRLEWKYSSGLTSSPMNTWGEQECQFCTRPPCLTSVPEGLCSSALMDTVTVQKKKLINLANGVCYSSKDQSRDHINTQGFGMGCSIITPPRTFGNLVYNTVLYKTKICCTVVA